MKIGVLLCGHAPEELHEKHGDYDAQFARLLGSDQFSYETWAVVDGAIPDDIHAADGWLISGSRHGAYEDHPWIPPLENFLRSAYQHKVPIVGICFGHQILAQALGGRVEKYAGGWSVGQVDYQVDRDKNATETASVHAFHQDQVVELPPDATVYGSTDFCANAFLAYGNQAMTMQPHPEFTDEFLIDLLAARGKALPPDTVAAGKQSVGPALSTKTVADEITAFFKQAHKGEQNSEP